MKKYVLSCMMLGIMMISLMVSCSSNNGNGQAELRGLFGCDEQPTATPSPTPTPKP